MAKSTGNASRGNSETCSAGPAPGLGTERETTINADRAEGVLGTWSFVLCPSFVPGRPWLLAPGPRAITRRDQRRRTKAAKDQGRTKAQGPRTKDNHQAIHFFVSFFIYA